MQVCVRSHADFDPRPGRRRAVRVTGTYNFTLQFHGTLSDMETNDGSMWPPVETAIQEQLGLQLRDTKAPAQVLVIDHIEMPSPN